ncbi:hypothetical protein EIP91_004274 [Steccherinum ochraceum]|uniref:Uncharacterized protein n=1 Tax=Steccherinum ochraceum TaxID=92696 RepID=A0A4R0RBL5_9APHY|nr:hypothetical protein EIP91_004274 [Steccherinum ochraceum]
MLLLLPMLQDLELRGISMTQGETEYLTESPVASIRSLILSTGYLRTESNQCQLGLQLRLFSLFAAIQSLKLDIYYDTECVCLECRPEQVQENGFVYWCTDDYYEDLFQIHPVNKLPVKIEKLDVSEQIGDTVIAILLKMVPQLPTVNDLTSLSFKCRYPEVSRYSADILRACGPRLRECVIEMDADEYTAVVFLEGTGGPSEWRFLSKALAECTNLTTLKLTGEVEICWSDADMLLVAIFMVLLADAHLSSIQHLTIQLGFWWRLVPDADRTLMENRVRDGVDWEEFRRILRQCIALKGLTVLGYVFNYTACRLFCNEFSRIVKEELAEWVERKELRVEF